MPTLTTRIKAGARPNHPGGIFQKHMNSSHNSSGEVTKIHDVLVEHQRGIVWQEEPRAGIDLYADACPREDESASIIVDQLISHVPQNSEPVTCLLH